MSGDVFNQTTLFRNELPDFSGMGGAALITIFDGASAPQNIDLFSFGKAEITFGREAGNDIVINSRYVSRHQHGCFRFSGNQWVIVNNPSSTNGLLYNNRNIAYKILEDGDSVRIDDGIETTANGVLIIFSTGSNVQWSTIATAGMPVLRIGRDDACEIRLDHVSISRLHARIVNENGIFYIIDNNSTNGVMLNGSKISGKVRLHEKDLILITNSKIIFSSTHISYCCFKSGISVDGTGLVKKVGKGRIICNNVDIVVNPCEMVTIVGGSGAGKSTLMNCLSGYSQPTSGTVTVNGIDLYANFDTLKNIIGYVPQSDIVYDNLTIHDMLLYAAKLRLPDDMSPGEVARRIDDVIATVELSSRKDTLIRNLSGGQRKRASIAVELMSDPNLLYLDEPASGLDPGTERNLMHTLRKMADGGKTVVFVTHSTLNLHICDKIAFMGVGGYLCFYGALEEALRFFCVDDVVDIYNLIATEQDSQAWNAKYLSMQSEKARVANASPTFKTHKKKRAAKQVAILFKRNLHIMLNDKTRMLMLLLQAPLLAFFISMVANEDSFTYTETGSGFSITKGLLFALACSAFWIGIMNSIQEVCKERVILKREYMAGVRLDAYVLSKLMVMTLVCAIQSVLLISVFSLLVGLPAEGVMMSPYLEMLITTFLTAMSATAMGIFVSSFFKNADRAMAVAPILLIPQILFSGMLFALSGASEVLSYIITCKWSMECLGTTANMNSLNRMVMECGMEVGCSEMTTEINQLGQMETVVECIKPETHDIDMAFEFTKSHLMTNWLVMAAFVVGFSVLAWLVLRRIDKERR